VVLVKPTARSTQKYPNEIYFAFFQVLFYFLWIFEVYTDFWKFNRKRKLKKGKNA
jgi:hypothetical protein